jgi:tRNA threonylcarbamoyladenosine modification (KEOPS) complex  Pcc1 subunit
MKAMCTLTIEFTDETKAHTVLQSIKGDDEGFVTSTVTGKTLQATIESTSIASLLHTLDDYLACVSVAADIAKK